MSYSIQNWEYATNEIVVDFAEKYFKADIDIIPYVHWVGGDIGGCLSIRDDYFDFDFIRESIKFNATKEKMLEYHHADIDAACEGKKLDISYRDFLKYGWDLNGKNN